MKQRVSLQVACGKRSLWIGADVNRTEIRVRSRITPKSTASWSAVVLQDRRIAWKGTVPRGEIDRKLVNLAGPEAISVRLTDGQGAVCVAELLTR